MRLAPDEIEVWTVALNVPPPSMALPPEETRWIEAAIDPRLRRRRAAARAALRRVVGACLDRDPAALRFEREPGGKPRLVGNDLRFNLSHSGDLMLLALAADREIGIDVDHLDRLDGDWQGVARLSFSPAERSGIAALPEAERSRAAMRLWIRKEAYSKALGGGFAEGFAGLAVAAGWSLVDLPVAAPMAACLAFAGEPATLSYRRFTS